MYFLAEVTDLSITSGACISFYGLIMVDAQVWALPLTPSFPCNDGELRNKVAIYAAFHASRDLLTRTRRKS
jgi:hypothetical protein